MRERGFTLVEVLVALTIFGLIAAGGVAILSFSVRAQGATAAKLDDVTALNRTVSVLSADLAQAQFRPARDERGTVLPAFVGEGASTLDPMLRLVRGGWSNLDGLARPSAQKVAYRVVNGTLERISWPMLDGAVAQPPAALLTGVREARLRYRFRGAWSDRWDGSGPAPLPDALELRLVRRDGRQYRALFLVGTGYAPEPQEAPNAPS
jgi:general secretion pathway protein J